MRRLHSSSISAAAPPCIFYIRTASSGQRCKFPPPPPLSSLRLPWLSRGAAAPSGAGIKQYSARVCGVCVCVSVGVGSSCSGPRREESCIFGMGNPAVVACAVRALLSRFVSRAQPLSGILGRLPCPLFFLSFSRSLSLSLAGSLTVSKCTKRYISARVLQLDLKFNPGCLRFRTSGAGLNFSRSCLFGCLSSGVVATSTSEGKVDYY